MKIELADNRKSVAKSAIRVLSTIFVICFVLSKSATFAVESEQLREILMWGGYVSLVAILVVNLMVIIKDIRAGKIYIISLVYLILAIVLFTLIITNTSIIGVLR